MLSLILADAFERGGTSQERKKERERERERGRAAAMDALRIEARQMRTSAGNRD